MPRESVLILLVLAASYSSTSRTCMSTTTFNTTYNPPSSSSSSPTFPKLPLNSPNPVIPQSQFFTLITYYERKQAMGDKPSTSGFLCHTCIWRERAESHELMDSEALMRHGQRFHYLQQSQIRGYLRAAFQVHRLPTPHDGSISSTSDTQLPLGLDGAGSFDGSKRVKEGAWVDEVKEEECQVRIKVEDVEEGKSPNQSSFGYFVNRSLGLDELQGDASYHHDHQHDSNYPTILPMELEIPEGPGPLVFHDNLVSLLSSVGEIKSDAQDPSFLPGNFYMPDPFVNNINGDWAHSMFLSAPHPVVNDLYQKYLMEEWTLAQFDYDLACSPVFAVQLQEYQDCMDAPRKTRDRLYIWPQKVVSAIDLSEQSLQRNEEDSGGDVPMRFDGKYGEAGEFMDLWNLVEHGCLNGPRVAVSGEVCEDMLVKGELLKVLSK